MTTYKVCSKCNCAVLTHEFKEHLAKHRQKPQINSDINSQEISMSIADDVFVMCPNCNKKIKMQYLASHKKICHKVLDVKVQAILNRIQKGKRVVKSKPIGIHGSNSRRIWPYKK